MTDARTIADHWARGDVYGLIVAALNKMSKPLDGLTVEDLAPVDHFHARGLAATVELADRLPMRAGQHIVDIGCGLGGPARYMAKRFQCDVSGVDITEPFVDAANKLTALLGMERQAKIELGDGQRLPYPDAAFDAGCTQHVTINVADRPIFFAEAYRVLKPGAFFALTEHGSGPKGDPHYPLPWSMDGSGAYLLTPIRDSSCPGRRRLRGHRHRGYRSQDSPGTERRSNKPKGRRRRRSRIHILLARDRAGRRRATAARNHRRGRRTPRQPIRRKPRCIGRVSWSAGRGLGRASTPQVTMPSCTARRPRRIPAASSA